MDLLGFGFSDRPTTFGYGVADHAEAVAALIRQISDGPVDLFGHSMGGAVAIAAAGLVKDRVHRLVLGEPNLDPGGGFFSRKIAALSEDEYRTHGHADLIRESQAAGSDIWAASLTASLPQAVHRGATSLVAGSTPTWRAQLSAFSGVKTVIFGEASLPDPDTDILSRAGVAIEIVPAAGHSMAWENPGGLARAIERALG